MRTAKVSDKPDDQTARLLEQWQRLLAGFASEGAGDDAAGGAALPTTKALAAWWGHLARQAPFAGKIFEEGAEVWQAVLGRSGIGTAATGASPLPREDGRFADPAWTEQPAFALIHQAYLMMGDAMIRAVAEADGLDEATRRQLRFATRALVQALSPANFAATNPLVIERTLETGGENLVRGMNNLLADLRRGQITHTDPHAFAPGRNLAITPGKVVHQTPLYQLIHYAPVTDHVLAVPLVLFPPWINRFYILDLNPQKSMVAWLLEQGFSVFMVSWKSADATIAETVWGDYIAAQIDAIDHVRERLEVPAVHAVGYCVAGTTLAATLALLARRGEDGRVRSATFFTAQVDFEKSGDLRLLVGDERLQLLESLARDGCFDGRYMAATFNMLRSADLIWPYVINNYLLGEDYPAFDVLHWNGDTTNLPWGWLKAYLTELYRDNRLVLPDSLTIDGTPLDLRRIETPVYVQAGRDDHIAPAESVFRLMHQVRGPARFVLAGSGHIAGVVNPPAASKYQYWTNPDVRPGAAMSFEAFVEGATETAGSWWPDWLAWLRVIDANTVPAWGKRFPGRRGDPVIEDAPGRYVLQR